MRAHVWSHHGIHQSAIVCQGLLSFRRHIGKREDPGDEVGIFLTKIFKMAVNGRNFNRVLERVCDISTIPSLNSEQKKKCLEALFEGKDVYASLPTGYGESLNLLCIPNRRLWAVLAVTWKQQSNDYFTSKNVRGRQGLVLKIFGPASYCSTWRAIKGKAKGSGKRSVYLRVRLSPKDMQASFNGVWTCFEWCFNLPLMVFKIILIVFLTD